MPTGVPNRAPNTEGAKTFTTDEVCGLLRVSRYKLYEMVAKKMIRPLAWQKNPYLFPKSEVDRVIKDMVGSQYYKED